MSNPINSTQQQRQPRKGQALYQKSLEIEGFRTLYETIPCICFTLNSAGRVITLSQLAAASLGYNAEELVNKPIESVFYREDQAWCNTKFNSLQQQPDQISQWEVRLVRKDGSLLWAKAIARLVPQRYSKPIISLICEDITDSKRTFKALQDSEELHRITLAHISDTVFITNNTGTFTFVCPNVEVIFGYSWQETLEKGNITNLLGEQLFNWNVLETCGEIQNIEREITDKAGKRHTLLVNVKRVLINGGTVLYSCRDITERKQAENELSQYRHHLERRVAERTAQLQRANEQLQQEISDRFQAEEALRQQFQREQLVGAMQRRIHQSLNLKDILNTTVTEVRQFLGCDRAIVFRLNCDGSGIVVVESVGCDWISIAGTIIDDRDFADSYIQLYQQGRVQAVEDINNAGLAQCHVELLAQFQVRANLVVPIVHEKKLWGLLVAQQCSGTRQWQPLEVDLLKSLSTQVAIAIQQSELYQQAQTEILQRKQAEEALRQQIQRERLIGAIAGRIRRFLKLEKILNATVAEVRQVLQTDRVVIFRFEPDWSGKVVVESVASSHFSIMGKSLFDPCFKQCYIRLYEQGRVKATEDIYAAKLSPCHINLLEQLHVRANLIVPILKQEKLWGLLIAHHCTAPRQWQQGEIDLLTTLAAQAAIAIQHSQLYEQAKSHYLREQLLNQLTQAIRSSLDLETIFATAVQKIGELLQVDHAHICQYLPERKIWLNISEYRKSLNWPVALGIEIPDENNEISARLKRLEIVKIDDADTCEDEINKGFAQTFPGAWLLVPLHFGSTVWGSFGLVKDIRPYQWQDWEVKLICAVVDQVAIAIQQAELYQQSRTATAQAVSQAQQLEQALMELQKAQTQLVQSEKMSSLGQLVAGVAHEINNPVSFIYGNLVHAHGYTNDLLNLVQLYQQHYPNPVPEISWEIEEIDLEFLMEDLPKLLSSMKVGAERICEIVAALRNFSRIAEAEVKAVDLHAGLDSTLMILQNRLKASGKHPEIKVIKEYSTLPLVECYAGQLNQVFMNLLVNAIDAIDEYNQTRTLKEIQDNPSFIRVRTELISDDEIAISIADNGPGMTEEVKARLFDPFFTTKPVGTGTGLGLSISYQIVVDKHGGQLHCYSQLGQGTEFVIQIPRSQQVQEFRSDN